MARSLKKGPHIDGHLLKKIEVTVRGKPQKMTTLEAILLQLWTMEVRGDPRALKIRLKFQDFAGQYVKPRTETVFVDNEYTKALATVPLNDGEDSTDE